ncbi:MAG TPA: ABC transporter substrate-binding protein [Ktedonobacteraceae bacterium]
MSRCISFLAMLLTFTLVLTACSSGLSSSGKATTHIKVWFPGNSGPESDLVIKTLVPTFEKANPDITVDVQYVDWGSLSPKLNTAFAGGIAPDVFGHGPAAAAGFVASDRVLPLDSYINTLDEATRNDFGSMLDAGLVNGHRYLLPMISDGVLFAYRTDFFQQAGLDPAHPPTNWDELQSDALKLTQRQGGKIVRAGLEFSNAGIGAEQTFSTFLYQAGGQLLNKEGTEVAWNSAAGVKALQFMVNFYNGPDATASKEGGSTGTLPITQQPLLTGQTAMELIDSGTLAGIQQAAPNVMKNIVVMPPLGLVQPAAYGGAGTGLFINKDSKHPDAAWRFIKYMTSVQTLQQYTDVTGTVPARASFLKSDLVQKRPFMKNFLEAQATNVFRPNPNIPAWVQARDVLTRYLEKAMAQQMTPKAALDAAAQEAGSLLTKK